MGRHVVIPHKLGWAKAASAAVLKVNAQHKEDRRTKPFAIIKEETHELMRAALDEIRNPLHWLNPVRVFVIWPVRGVGTVIGLAGATILKMSKARKASLAKKKAAMQNVGYMILEEMQRDSKYKEEIAALVKDESKGGKGLQWLYVDRKGRIILSKDSKISDSHSGGAMGRYNLPRINMAELVNKANLKYVDAVPQKQKLMVAVRGNSLHISKIDGKKSTQEVISKPDYSKLQALKAKDSRKIILKFWMKSGAVRQYTVDKEEGKRIFKQLKK